MKIRTVMLILVMIIMTVSCIPSLYPLYRERDLLFDKQLLGRFDVDGTIWEFDSLDWERENSLNNDWSKYKSGKTYKLEAWQDSIKAEFAVHLLKLRGNYYLDFFPVEYEIGHSFLCWHLVPAHIFGKIEFVGEDVVIRWFDGEFLNDLIDSNRIKISHKKLEYTILLTAKTGELQGFVKKYGDDPRALVEPDDPDTLYRCHGECI